MDGRSSDDATTQIQTSSAYRQAMSEDDHHAQPDEESASTAKATAQRSPHHSRLSPWKSCTILGVPATAAAALRDQEFRALLESVFNEDEADDAAVDEVKNDDNDDDEEYDDVEEEEEEVEEEDEDAIEMKKSPLGDTAFCRRPHLHQKLAAAAGGETKPARFDASVQHLRRAQRVREARNSFDQAMEMRNYADEAEEGAPRSNPRPWVRQADGSWAREESSSPTAAAAAWPSRSPSPARARERARSASHASHSVLSSPSSPASSPAVAAVAAAGWRPRPSPPPSAATARSAGPKKSPGRTSSSSSSSPPPRAAMDSLLFPANLSFTTDAATLRERQVAFSRLMSTPDKLPNRASSGRQAREARERLEALRREETERAKKERARMHAQAVADRASRVNKQQQQQKQQLPRAPVLLPASTATRPRPGASKGGSHGGSPDGPAESSSFTKALKKSLAAMNIDGDTAALLLAAQKRY